MRCFPGRVTCYLLLSAELLSMQNNKQHTQLDYNSTQITLWHMLYILYAYA